MLKVLAIFIYVSHKHTCRVPVFSEKSAWRVVLFSLLLLKIYDHIYRFFLKFKWYIYLIYYVFTIENGHKIRKVF